MRSTSTTREVVNHLRAVRPHWFAASLLTVLCLQLGAAAQQTPYQQPIRLYYAVPKSTSGSLIGAVRALRRADAALDRGDQPSRADLHSAAHLLRSASSEPRTYRADADVLIRASISLGHYFYSHGDVAVAYGAWGTAVQAVDRAETKGLHQRQKAPEQALSLYLKGHYPESFAMFSKWRRSLGFSPNLDVGSTRVSYTNGLDAAANARWNDAIEAFSKSVTPDAGFRDGDLALGEVYQIVHRHSEAVSAWVRASNLSNSGDEPPFTTVSIDALRLLLHFRR